MRINRAIMSAGVVLGLNALAGCQLLIEIRDYVVVGETGGGGGAGATTAGNGGEAGTGGGSTTMACEPGAEQPCYDGPPDTEGVGPCEAGTQVCNADGTGHEACEGAVLPGTETCADTTDENCDHWDCVLWASGHGDSNLQTPTDIAVDGAGNVYVVGSFQGTVDFGGEPLVSSGGYDLFLVKLDATGKHVWSKKFGDAQDQTSISVVADASGSAIITGTFEGTLQIGDAMLINTGPSDIFLAKLDADGEKVWAWRLSDDESVSVNDIAGYDNGDFIIVGDFTGDFNPGPAALSSEAVNVFYVRFDGITGGAVWAKSLGNSNGQLSHSIALDGNENIIIGGITLGSFTQEGMPTPLGRFIARLDQNGASSWHRVIPDGISLFSTDFRVVVASDKAGNVLGTSTFTAPINAGGADLEPVDGHDVFLAKYDAAGNHLWSKGYGTPQDEEHPRIVTDSDGNILLAASSGGSVDLGGGALPNKGGADLVVVKLSPAGEHIWSRSFGGAGTQDHPAIAAAASGESVIACEFGGSIDFGTGPILSKLTDVAVAKLAR